MVEVRVGDIIWEIAWKYDHLVICRGDRILGYTWQDIPSSRALLDVALEGICQDIKEELEKEKREIKG